MTIVNSAEGITLDDLLEAINPQPPTMDGRIRNALGVVAQYRREGHISDADADALVSVLVDASITAEVSDIALDYFTPRNRQRRDGRINLISP